MAFDARVQNVLEKKPGLTDSGVATGVKKTRSDRPRCGTGVTKFCMASGGLKFFEIYSKFYCLAVIHSQIFCNLLVPDCSCEFQNENLIIPPRRGAVLFCRLDEDFSFYKPSEI